MRNIYFLLILAFLSRCGKDVPPPAYLKIDDFVLLNNPDVFLGNLTHNFSDVQVFIDDQPYGIFPIPTTIPVNIEGSLKVELRPVIRRNGMSEEKIPYPMVEWSIHQLQFNRLDTTYIQPETKYRNNSYVWFEDFEDAAVQFESTGLSTIDIVKSNDPTILDPRNENFFGLVQLSSENFLWDALTTTDWPLNPGIQRIAYIELDFYNTSSIQMGLRAQNIVGINNFQHVFMPSQKIENLRWRKIYIDITSLIGIAGSGNNFRLKLSSVINSVDTESIVAIDNVKLVYR